MIDMLRCAINRRQKGTAMHSAVRLAALLLLAVTGGAAFAQVEAPDALIKTTFEEAKAIVRQTTDPKKLRQAAEQKLLPYFDFAQMTRLAVGPGWRRATPEQRETLTQAFRSLLVSTYTSALNQASSLLDKTLEVRPPQRPDDKDVLVRSVLRSPGKQPLAIDYRMLNDGKGWKVYDVVVEGVSLVTTYRSEFSDEVQRGGVPGLIKALEEKNRSLAARQG
jgi:phospholipid transport system substrate-binding protein